jgi:hypothetical protein
MIEKMTPYLMTGYLEQKPLSSFPISTASSPFNQILSHELGSQDPLETLFLNYLIKTIESILAKPDTKDLWSMVANIPFSGGDTFIPQPASKKPVSETAPDRSNPKNKSQEIDKIIDGAALQYGVDPSLIRAVISVESNGNPRAVSPVGAQGLMQLMPGTAAELGVTDPFDPKQNITAGTRYLSQLLERYQGNQKLALAAYNWGMGNLERKPEGLPRETQNYIARVEKQYQSFLNSASAA